MLDIIFVVENSEDWHLLNMSLNPTHYSSIFPLSPRMTANIQVASSFDCS